ncbi:sialic acid synthase-like [Anopheles albimanus]|uniref:sialic acid synthase-like n=1 Tax=Anopheles albimanus TaxID=7167 RepID=UPI0016416C7B|nr:sialic acid synthase-like [Anopheles albimanus]
MWCKKEDRAKVFVVAEIGQNHQGSLEIAKQMIRQAKNCGADCVKFQRSNLEAKFTAAALARPYEGSQSWGKTYGQHKAHLEFSFEEYRELQRFARDDVGVLFTASAMDMVSFRELEEQLKVPFIKIGSGDANNVPLLRYAATRPIPLIVSTGMQSWDEICNIRRIFAQRCDVALLHCISAYPTPPEDTMLQLIPLYRQHFPELTVGYSGHELGIQLTVASVALGAQIVERHFTLDKAWKGTDHRASLDPEEFQRMVKGIRMVEERPGIALPINELVAHVLDSDDYDEAALKLALREITVDDRKLLNSERACSAKLGKSLVYSNDLTVGHTLRVTDLDVKVSQPQGLSPWLYDAVIGSTVRQSVTADGPVLAQHF